MPVCTIVARNYLALARVLAHSLVEVTGQRPYCLVIDAEPGEVDPARELFSPVFLEDLDLSAKERYEMLAIYDVMEFSTAVKPWVIEYVARTEGWPVIYLDPDICVYSGFDELFEMAEEFGLVLIPHVLSPIPSDGKRPSAEEILASGVFNLGFLGVGEAGSFFLQAWKKRLGRYCIVDISRNLFVDQRFCDVIPVHFRAAIVRDPRHNVAYWNVAERTLQLRDGTYLVDGRPLSFFHFSGYDPEVPWRLSKHQGDSPRLELLESDFLVRITSDYSKRLAAAGHKHLRRLAYRYDSTPSGLALDRFARRAYRAALLVAEDRGGPPPPNPFHSPEVSFLSFLRAGPSQAELDYCQAGDLEKEALGKCSSTPLSRYLTQVWLARRDLQLAFPSPAGKDLKPFLSWARSAGLKEGLLAGALP